MSFKWQGTCLSAVLLVSLMPLCHAQSVVTPEEEYKKLIRVNEDIQPLGPNPFGEQVSLYNGSLSFDQTDVSLPGNGPLLQLSRSLHTKQTLGVALDGAFSDWDLDVPRITTQSADLNNGWTVITGVRSTARCSSFGPPPNITSSQGVGDWDAQDWWSGYQLIVPGEGSQDLLQRGSANTLSPTMGSATFPIVTTKNWMITCGVQTDDEPSGEGFTAVAPDGSKYTFNHLVYEASTTEKKSFSGDYDPNAKNLLNRHQASMLVTHIQDRFGNWLTYSYDVTHPNNLTGIAASDGRQLSIAYDTHQRVSSATLQPSSGSPRTWTYQYDTNGLLSGVTLPDGTAWSFAMAPISLADMTPISGGNCDTPAGLPTQQWTGTMTHPSGLVGSFTIQMAVRGRSNVPRQCNMPDGTIINSYAAIPKFYYQPVIRSKTFTGAGLFAGGETWTYTYSPQNDSWSSDCANGCISTVWTDVVDPLGHDVRSTFSNEFDETEGQLQNTDYYTGAAGSTLLRSETNQYASATAGPWPTDYGVSLQTHLNLSIVEKQAPLNQRVITQHDVGGTDTYTWQAESFDPYTQVTKTKRCNSISLPCDQSPLEETTTYRNDTTLWVLGLPLQVTNNNYNEVESSNTYNTSNDTLLTRARFGQTLMNYTFNAQGQLASFTDGNSHTTSLSNYKRGIPQTISYPDSTSETLVVDDFGQISAITDQAGHTSSYGYDSVGRITGISYPTGDEVAWLPKAFSYDFVTSAERGVPANHWRRTTTTGNAKAVTYFNAMLQPVLSDSAIGSAVQASTLTTYDAKGQKVFSAYPSATALTFSLSPTVAGSTTTYDALGRTTQIAQASELGTLTSSTAYLSSARQQVTDPKGNVTTTSYQVFDSPSYEAVTKVQAPTGITQTIARDLYGNPLSITQTGLYGATETDTVIKKLFYDSYHRLCRTSEPESGSTIMAYDSANNLAWSAEGLTIPDTNTTCAQDQVTTAAKTTRTYDAMNRVLTIQPPAGTQSTQYHYTSLGQPDSVVSGISTWTAAYNFRGMLTGESLQLTGQNAWGIGYAHDAYGSLSLIHYPDGENVSYAPDALGRATQVGNYATGIGYFPNGQVSDFIYGNGTAYVAEQNDRQLLSNFSYGTGTTPQLSEDLSYDKNGNITTVTDLAGGPRSKSFGYDALNRLTSAQSSGLAINETYAYDALNNLRSRLTGGQTLTYNYDPTNKLANITSGASTVSSYVYDNRGNVINNNGTNLTFDEKNQLTQIQGFDSYAYDASGRRVMKNPHSATAPVYYFYSQAGQLMYQVDAATLKSTNYIYLGSRMIARNENNGTPVLSTPSISSTGTYTVSWSGIGGATTYTLQEQVNGGSWTPIQSSGATSDPISGKADGSYGYRVQACNGTICAPWSGTAVTIVVHPPATPASITVPATSSGSVPVSWAASSTATSYTLQQKLGSGSWGTVYTGAVTNSTRTITTTGSYTYQVAACNAGGCSTYKVSSAVVVTIPPASAPTLTVPATSSTGSYTVSWTAVAAATSYTLQEQVNGGSWATIQATSATSKALSGKADGTYGYKVQACNAGGCAGWSSTQSIVVTHPPTAAPSLTVPSSNISGSYSVSWGAVSLATSYTLQEQFNGGAWATIQTSSAISKAISNKASGTYGYRVQGCNAGGCGPWSSTHSVVVLRIPVTPYAPSLSFKSPAIVTASWTAVTDAATYTVEYSPSQGGTATTFYTGPNNLYSNSVFYTGQLRFHTQACNASGCSAWSSYSYITLNTELN